MYTDVDYIDYLYTSCIICSDEPLISMKKRSMVYHDVILEANPVKKELAIVYGNKSFKYQCGFMASRESSHLLSIAYRLVCGCNIALAEHKVCDNWLHATLLKNMHRDELSCECAVKGNIREYTYVNCGDVFPDLRELKVYFMNSSFGLFVQFKLHGTTYVYFCYGGPFGEWYLVRSDGPLFLDEVTALNDYISMDLTGMRVPSEVKWFDKDQGILVYAESPFNPRQVTLDTLIGEGIYPSSWFSEKHGWYTVTDDALLDYVLCAMREDYKPPCSMVTRTEKYKSVKETGSKILTISAKDNSCTFYRPAGYNCVYMSMPYEWFTSWAYETKYYVHESLRSLSKACNGDSEKLVQVLTELVLNDNRVQNAWKDAVTKEFESLRTRGEIK